MKEQSTERLVESRPVWEGLEAFARHGVQELLQRMLEEEVGAMLRRRRYARREGVDAAAGYRNGYGEPRRLSLSVEVHVALVAVSHEIGSIGSKIGMGVAKELGYRYVDEDAICHAAQHYGCSQAKLARFDEAGPSLMQVFEMETRYCLTALEAAVLDVAEANDAVIMGRYGHMLLQGIRHALRMLVVAPTDVRVNRLMQDDSLPSRRPRSDRGAADLVRRRDRQTSRRIWDLFETNWREATLYDLSINTEVISTKTAVEGIITILRSPELLPTESSRQAVRNRALASRIRCALAANKVTRRYRVKVEAEGGIVTLEGAQLLGHAVKVARSVPGVVDVKAHFIAETAIPLFPLSRG